jgi:hypothetical protein
VNGVSKTHGHPVLLRLTHNGWRRKFEDPIELPDGRKLITLRDAALYITKLAKAEHDAPEWQAAMRAFLLVPEHDGQRC